MKNYYEIEILSPVHIGSGDKWTAFSDYITLGDTTYIIDFDRFIQNEINDIEIINNYSNEVKKSNYLDQNGYKYYLENFFYDYCPEVFIDDKKNKFTDDFKEKYTVKTFKMPKGMNKREIGRIITNAGSPYIAGSSIKGAIRTALLDSEIKNKFNNIQNMKYTNNFEKAGYVGQDYFRKNPKNVIEDVFKHLLVSDSGFFQETEIYNIGVEHIYKEHEKDGSTPVMIEAISNGKSTFKLKCKGEKEYLAGKYDYLLINNESELLKKVDNYYKERAKEELEIFKKEKTKEYISIVNFLEKNVLKEEKDTYIIRLGKHKTFYDMSISDNLHDDEFIKAIKLKKGITREIYPITRSIIQDSNVPLMGWVRIRKVDE
jgi:CRISPR-associated protein Csm5